MTGPQTEPYKMMMWVGTSDERVGWVQPCEMGAVELWQDTRRPTVCGLEFHSATPTSRDEQPTTEHCQIIGGECWNDGSTWGAHRFLREQPTEGEIWSFIADHAKRWDAARSELDSLMAR